MAGGATLQIRREQPDHPEVAPLLAALDIYLASLYPPEANHILDIAALRAPEVDFLAAWQSGRVVGCGASRRLPGEPATGGQPYGEIKRMFVLPSQRGQRVAEQLLAALEAGLGGQGIGQALLETGRDQREAVRLYERCGYARRGAFGGYPDNGLSLFMHKRIAT